MRPTARQAARTPALAPEQLRRGHLEAGELIAERVEALQAVIQPALLLPRLSPLRFPLPAHCPDPGPPPRALGRQTYKIWST